MNVDIRRDGRLAGSATASPAVRGGEDSWTLQGVREAALTYPLPLYIVRDRLQHGGCE